MTDNVSQMDAYRKLQSRNLSSEPELPLYGGGGGGTSGGMDLMDAKISASEARTDTKFAELRGDLKNFATKGTVWTAVGTALGIMLAVAALAGNRFDAGMTIRSTVEAVTADQHRRDSAQDAKLDEILKRLPAQKPTSTTSPSSL